MPYQPINPVPHNIGIEANKDNYDFSFTVDKYDRVEKVEIRIYDYYNNNKHLYTITRSYDENAQYLTIFDEVRGENIFEDPLSENEMDEFSKLPLIGGKEDSSEFYLPLGLIANFDATSLFKGNKKYSWNVKLTGDKHDVWITENNTFADEDSYLPTIYVPNNTRIEPNQQIVLGGDSIYRINNVERYSHEGKIYYRQSKGKATNTLSYYSMLNSYITYQGTTDNKTITEVTITDKDFLNYLKADNSTDYGTCFNITDITLSNQPQTQRITGFKIKEKENDPGKYEKTGVVTITPGFTVADTTKHESLITIVTNIEEINNEKIYDKNDNNKEIQGTLGALITKGIIPNEWIYMFEKDTIQSASATDFYYKGTLQTATLNSQGSNEISFSPGFISTKEGDLTADITLAKNNEILPSDIGEYEIIIIGDKEMEETFINGDPDFTDVYITLNYINYFQVERIELYPRNLDSYYKYGLEEGEKLFKVIVTEIINPTKYQVDSPALAKDYLLERQSSILTVDPNALSISEEVASRYKYNFTQVTAGYNNSSKLHYFNFVLDLDYNDSNLKYFKVGNKIEFYYRTYLNVTARYDRTQKFILSNIKHIDKSSQGKIIITTTDVDNFKTYGDKYTIIDDDSSSQTGYNIIFDIDKKFLFVENNENEDKENRIGRIITDVTDEVSFIIRDLSSKYITFESFINMQNKVIENEKITYVFDNDNIDKNKKEKVLFFNFPEDWTLDDIKRFQGNIITNNLVYIFDKVSEDNDEYIPLILTSNDIVNANQSFVIYSDNIVSPYYYFSVLPERKIEFFLETKEGMVSPNDNQFNVDSIRAKIVAEYDGNIAYYTWKLVRDNGEEEDEVIEQTKEEFTSYMEYEYEMLEPGTYKLTLVITTEEGCTIQAEVRLNVEYGAMNNPFDINASIDCDKKAIKVAFTDFKQIKGYVYKQNVNGEYILIGDNTEEESRDGFEITTNVNENEGIIDYYNCYIKPGYKIQWDKIIPLENNTYIDISKDFTLMSRFKLGNRFNGDILELIDINGVSYSLSLTQNDEVINFVMKKGTEETTTDNSGLYTGTALELQKETEIEGKEEVLYYYFDFGEENQSEENQLDFSSDSSKFIIERDPASENWFTMVMRKGIIEEKNKTIIEIYKGDIVETSKPNYILTLDITDDEANYCKLMAYGDINWNYIHVFNNDMEESNINQLLCKNNYIPEWSLDTYMLMNFTGNTDTSYINIDAVPINNEYFLGTLYKFVLFRSEIDDNGKETIKKKIAEIQPSRTAFYDYAVEKKRKYIYTIVPYFFASSDEMDKKFIVAGSPMYTSKNGIGLFYDYISLYSGISLYLNEDLSMDGNLKQDENTYLLDNTQKPWYFKYNLESGDITINTDKNVFEGLFPYAKVNKGLKNYRTGSITALIGEFKGDSNDLSSLVYYDSIKMANEFQAFCDTNTVKILRDEMGNIIPVDVTLKSIKYDNKNTPSTIIVSFEWTQVGSHDTVSLFEVEGGSNE